MSKIESVRANALSESSSTEGITRDLAFKDNDKLVVRARSVPGAISGWHHHGDHDVYGYLASGSARLESGHGGQETIAIGPGDFFHVPPRTVHREINPSAEEGQEFVLFLSGTGPLVVNVDGPEKS
jgi:uncharacterized RmlC-like cupin family protein